MLLVSIHKQSKRAGSVRRWANKCGMLLLLLHSSTIFIHTIVNSIPHCHAWLQPLAIQHKLQQWRQRTSSSTGSSRPLDVSRISPPATTPLSPAPLSPNDPNDISNHHHHPVSMLTIAAKASSSSNKHHKLSKFESYCAAHMDAWYEQSLKIKCPFFRRRMADSLETLDNIMRFLLIRHKSLDLLGPKPAWKCQGNVCDKQMGLETNEILEMVKQDWCTHNDKGYYITGRLNSSIYRDDCFFDGPDPDMPVTGLRKYLNAASQLFEQATSRSKLLSIRILQDDSEGRVIVADWKMKGVLRLPWKPRLPTWTGTTYYYIDDTGLIYKHTETWDMSVVEAFVKTLMPSLANLLWSHAH